MTILLRDRVGQGRWQALVFFAALFDRAPCHEILKLFIGPQTQHFFAATGSVPGPQILVYDIEKLLKLKRRTPGEDRNQLLSYQVGNTTGECI